jgi:hypothetical protein
MRWLAYLYNLLSFIIQIEASISDNFYKFMVIKHGKEFADSVARHDFGNMGSFGGGKTHKPGTKTRSEYFKLCFLDLIKIYQLFFVTAGT